jgi:uncharacterized protein (TIRG00374 family)
MAEAGSKGKAIWKIIPGILISILAFYAVLKFVNFDDLLHGLRTVDGKFILIIAVLDVLGLAVRGKAWQTILGNQILWKQSFFGVSEGYFLNNILPFRAGEIGRSFFVGHSSGLGTFYILSTIVIERAFDIAFAAFCIVLTLPFVVGVDWIKPIATVALVVVVFGMICLFLLARYKEKVVAWVGIHEKKSKFYQIVLPRVKGLIEGFSSIAKPGQFLLSLFWIAVCWVVWSAIYYYSIIQIIPSAGLWSGPFLTGLLAMGVAIPSAPASLGVFEASFTGAVALLGGSTSIALAYALVLHLIQFIIVGILGMWGLSKDRSSLSVFLRTVFQNGSNPKIVDGIKE